jgi:hypothetical protein
MSISQQTLKTLPDQFDDFTKRMALEGITITPLPHFGVYGFMAEKGSRKLKVLWDNRDDLLLIDRFDGLSWSQECGESVSTLTRDKVYALAHDLLVARLSSSE